VSSFPLLSRAKRKSSSAAWNERTLPLWLRIAGIMLLIGQWCFALFPGYAVHGVHLTFAGGYSLLTLLIATRVVLSHGGYDLSLELKSRGLHVVGALVAASAFARFLAPLAPHTYFHHLAYASFGWSLGVGAWALFFLPRMWVSVGPPLIQLGLSHPGRL
jgi:hypothetical protein